MPVILPELDQELIDPSDPHAQRAAATYTALRPYLQGRDINDLLGGFGLLIAHMLHATRPDKQDALRDLKIGVHVMLDNIELLYDRNVHSSKH